MQLTKAKAQSPIAEIVCFPLRIEPVSIVVVRTVMVCRLLVHVDINFRHSLLGRVLGHSHFSVLSYMQ